MIPCDMRMRVRVSGLAQPVCLSVVPLLPLLPVLTQALGVAVAARLALPDEDDGPNPPKGPRRPLSSVEVGEDPPKPPKKPPPPLLVVGVAEPPVEPLAAAT